MTPARFVFRDPDLTDLTSTGNTSFCPTSEDSTAKDFGNSPAYSPTMPSAGTKSCREILKESVSSVARGSTSDVTSSFSSSAAVDTVTTRTSTTELSSTQHLQQTRETQGPPTCIRRSSSSSSGRVSFGTIEIHVVEPVPVPDTTAGPAVDTCLSESETAQTSAISTSAGDAKEEEETSSSSSNAVEGNPCLPSLKASAQHVDPTTTQTCHENKDTNSFTEKEKAKDTSADDEQQPNDLPTPPKEEKSAAPKQEPIKCGLETYERLRPPRRSRTELFLDAVRERSRRKLSHQPLSEEVIEAQKGLADKKNNSQAAATAAIVDGGGGHVDNNHCTLRRSDAVMTRSSHLSLEATKNRRSKRLDRLQGAAEGEIEKSETGGLRSWSSNYGGGARL